MVSAPVDIVFEQSGSADVTAEDFVDFYEDSVCDPVCDFDDSTGISGAGASFELVELSSTAASPDSPTDGSPTSPVSPGDQSPVSPDSTSNSESSSDAAVVAATLAGALLAVAALL